MFISSCVCVWLNIKQLIRASAVVTLKNGALCCKCARAEATPGIKLGLKQAR